MNIKTINEWILVEKQKGEEEKTKSGIVLPGKKTDDVVKRATVVQISDEAPALNKKEKGEDAELKYVVGDTVLFYGKTGIPVKEDGKEYMFLRYDGMIAVEVE